MLFISNSSPFRFILRNISRFHVWDRNWVYACRVILIGMLLKIFRLVSRSLKFLSHDIGILRNQYTHFTISQHIGVELNFPQWITEILFILVTCKSWNILLFVSCVVIQGHRCKYTVWWLFHSLSSWPTLSLCCCNLEKKTSRLRKAQQLIMLCTDHPALFTSILVYLTMSKLNDQPTNGWVGSQRQSWKLRAIKSVAW